MKDLSLHILDIVENSVKAGAKTVNVEFDWKGTWLTLRISDDGPGFPDSVKDNPADPFKTTRKERKVGLGLPLLKDSAEQAGGHLVIGRSKAGGVHVEATFNMAHIDSKPTGDLADLIVTCITAWPQMNWVVRLGDQGEVLDTGLVKKELGDVDIKKPQIISFISAQLRKDFRPLEEWAGAIRPSL